MKYSPMTCHSKGLRNLLSLFIAEAMMSVVSCSIHNIIVRQKRSIGMIEFDVGHSTSSIIVLTSAVMVVAKVIRLNTRHLTWSLIFVLQPRHCHLSRLIVATDDKFTYKYVRKFVSLKRLCHPSFGSSERNR